MGNYLERVELKATRFIAEAALWVDWVHEGPFQCADFGYLLQISAQAFGRCMMEHSQADCGYRSQAFAFCRAYAKLFLEQLTLSEQLARDLLSAFTSEKELMKTMASTFCDMADILETAEVRKERKAHM